MLDSAAFRQLAVEELDAVHRMACHLTRDSHEAQDLVQETYLRALRAEAGFEMRERGVRPWLFKILHNVFYTKKGKQKRELTLAEDLQHERAAHELDQPPPVWDVASLNWDHTDERLKWAMQELHPQYREVILLWAVEGLKYKEIAEVMDIPLGTVMSRLYRARNLLSQQLAEMAREHGIHVGQDDEGGTSRAAGLPGASE